MVNFIQKDSDSNLPKECIKEDINQLRAEVMYDVLNDMQRRWNVLNYFTNSSPKKAERAMKKRTQVNRKFKRIEKLKERLVIIKSELILLTVVGYELVELKLNC